MRPARVQLPVFLFFEFIVINLDGRDVEEARLVGGQLGNLLKVPVPGHPHIASANSVSLLQTTHLASQLQKHTSKLVRNATREEADRTM